MQGIGCSVLRSAPADRSTLRNASPTTVCLRNRWKGLSCLVLRSTLVFLTTPSNASPTSMYLANRCNGSICLILRLTPVVQSNPLNASSTIVWQQNWFKRLRSLVLRSMLAVLSNSNQCYSYRSLSNVKMQGFSWFVLQSALAIRSTPRNISASVIYITEINAFNWLVSFNVWWLLFCLP